MKFSRSIVLLSLAGYSHAFSSFTPKTTIFQKNTSSSNTKLQMASEKPRVVVTGLGVVSGCGVGHEDFFQACIDGKSSIDTVKRFDASAYTCKIASEVPDEMFDPKDHFDNVKNIRTNDRFTHLAVAAARLALKDAKIGDVSKTMEEDIGCDNIGVMVGTAFGGMETFERETLKLNARPDRPKVCI